MSQADRASPGMDEAAVAWRNAAGSVQLASLLDEQRAFVLWLNRPERRNAMDEGVLAGVPEAIAWAGARGARVLLVRGRGGHFSAGADLDALQRSCQAGEARRLLEDFAGMLAAVQAAPCPVIAAVEGYAVAGGLELALACDWIVAREDACLADWHLRRGLIPGGGASQRLPRLLPPGIARRMLLAGASLSGAEAARLGLAASCLSPETWEAGLVEEAERVAGLPAAAIAALLRLLRETRPAAGEAGLAREREQLLDLLARGPWAGAAQPATVRPRDV